MFLNRERARYSTAAHGQRPTTLIVQSNGYNSHTLCVCLNYTRTTEQNWKTKHWSKFISFSLFKETPLLCTWTGCICFHVRIGQLIIITLVMGETCLVRRLFSSDKFLPRIGYADMLTTSGEKNNKVCGFIVYLLRPSVKKKLALLPWNLFKNKIKKWKGTIVNRQNIASTNSYFIIIF